MVSNQVTDRKEKKSSPFLAGSRTKQVRTERNESPIVPESIHAQQDLTKYEKNKFSNVNQPKESGLSKLGLMDMEGKFR